jgi:hypothetical protein
MVWDNVEAEPDWREVAAIAARWRKIHNDLCAMPKDWSRRVRATWRNGSHTLGEYERLIGLAKAETLA